MVGVPAFLRVSDPETHRIKARRAFFLGSCSVAESSALVHRSPHPPMTRSARNFFERSLWGHPCRLVLNSFFFSLPCLDPCPLFGYSRARSLKCLPSWHTYLACFACWLTSPTAPRLGVCRSRKESECVRAWIAVMHCQVLVPSTKCRHGERSKAILCKTRTRTDTRQTSCVGVRSWMGYLPCVP